MIHPAQNSEASDRNAAAEEGRKEKPLLQGALHCLDSQLGRSLTLQPRPTPPFPRQKGKAPEGDGARSLQS